MQLNKIKGFDTITVSQKLKIDHYTLKQGLMTADFHPNCSFVDDDNSIWFGQKKNYDTNTLLKKTQLESKEIPNFSMEIDKFA